MMADPGLPLTTGEGNTAQELRGRIEWYVQCLRDAGAGKSVRGMGEARAGYESALAECGRLREQLDATNAKIVSLATDFLNEQATTRARDFEQRDTIKALREQLAESEAANESYAVEAKMAREELGAREKLLADIEALARAALGVEGPAAGDGQP